MCARMMLSEKLKDAIVIVPFGLAELDGPPVEPHEVVTSARATMLAPRTKIRFRYIAHLQENDRNYAATIAVSRAVPNGSSFWTVFDGRSPAGVARRCAPASENSTINERMATMIAPANIIG